MPRRAPAALLAAVLAAFPLAPSAAPRADGRIESDEGRVELFSRPVRVGERIELPEGYLVVEEAGDEDERVGSFTVVSADSFVAAAPAAPAVEADAGDPAAGAPPARECDAERAAYLEELWKESGIEVSDPTALLEGLQGGAAGPAAGFYWFALATDPFRPLAWSSELRSRADALARCVKAQ
jgi:hypothetical protein